MGYQENFEQGLQEGRQIGAAWLVIRLLTKRLGGLRLERIPAILNLPLEQLESIVDAIFELETDADLAPWLG